MKRKEIFPRESSREICCSLLLPRRVTFWRCGQDAGFRCPSLAFQWLFRFFFSPMILCCETVLLQNMERIQWMRDSEKERGEILKTSFFKEAKPSDQPKKKEKKCTSFNLVSILYTTVVILLESFCPLFPEWIDFPTLLNMCGRKKSSRVFFFFVFSASMFFFLFFLPKKPKTLQSVQLGPPFLDESNKVDK